MGAIVQSTDPTTFFGKDAIFFSRALAKRRQKVSEGHFTAVSLTLHRRRRPVSNTDVCDAQRWTFLLVSHHEGSRLPVHQECSCAALHVYWLAPRASIAQICTLPQVLRQEAHLQMKLTPTTNRLLSWTRTIEGGHPRIDRTKNGSNPCRTRSDRSCQPSTGRRRGLTPEPSSVAHETGTLPLLDISLEGKCCGSLQFKAVVS